MDHAKKLAEALRPFIVGPVMHDKTLGDTRLVQAAQIEAAQAALAAFDAAPRNAGYVAGWIAGRDEAASIADECAKQNGPLSNRGFSDDYRRGFESAGQAIAAAIRTLPATTQETDLTDPNAVHANMLRGAIAKPTLGQIIHIYGIGALCKALAPEIVREANAAPPAMKVKPLEWFEAELPSRGGGKWQSEGYAIRKIEGLFLIDFAGDKKHYWRFSTLEAAKAAAQADYESRILAALEPRPGDPQ